MNSSLMIPISSKYYLFLPLNVTVTATAPAAAHNTAAIAAIGAASPVFTDETEGLPVVVPEEPDVPASPVFVSDVSESDVSEPDEPDSFSVRAVTYAAAE